MRVYVTLSKLNPSRRNPRWVKPSPEAQKCLVASIRAFDLLEPLVVRPMPDREGEYQVIAGGRRLAALRQIHRQSKEDPKIPCEIRDVDDVTADAMSLSENFVREPMHPLDEAEAFAKLAADEAKGVDVIAAEFGITERYVRQRMKLADLAEVVKTALRRDEIDIATAEAFAAVPKDRQLAIWQELNGQPRHAQHVRNIIASAWIDASHALFNLALVPESAVSRDLFNDQVLIERSAFMEAQTQALEKERAALREDGWAQVVAAAREEVNDRLYSMREADPELDERTNRKLVKLEERRKKLVEKREALDESDEEGSYAIEEKIEALNQLAAEVIQAAPKQYAEKTKALGTAFLMLGPDGRVYREFRLPRPAGRSSNGSAPTAGGGAVPDPEPPTSEKLSDQQLAVTFIHQTLAVREALLKTPNLRNRILALILHEKVNSEALAMRHEVNGVTLNATRGDGIASDALTRLTKKRAELDPFVNDHFIEDLTAYDHLCKLAGSRLSHLIELLVVECVTAHLQRRTELVHRLAQELKINVRDHWRPDAAWLAGYQKIQLAHLMAELYGKLYDCNRESRKKSELVEVLAKLFADAAGGKFEDKQLAERVNAWLPANLREGPEEASAETEPASAA